MKLAFIAAALALAANGASAAPAAQPSAKAAPKDSPIIMYPVSLEKASSIAIVTKMDKEKNGRNGVQITMTSK